MLRPFGMDVLEHQDGDRMPPVADCVRDSICSLLSSSGDKWLKTRAVLTESSLFLSNAHDRTLAVHRIPLHEITKIVKTSHDAENRGINKHKAVAHGTLDKHVSQLRPDSLGYYSSDDSDEGEEDKAAHLLSSTEILQINTVAEGYNFGRIYTLRFKDETTCEEWKKELLVPHSIVCITIECVLLLQNVFSYYRMCSLTIECVLLERIAGTTHPHTQSLSLTHSLTH